MISSELLRYLLRINRRRVRMMRQALLPHQYVGTMHLVMRYISIYPGASQEEIAKHFALDKTSVARDARRLEDMGHIRREIDSANRRQYKLYLTQDGDAFLPTIDAAYDAFAQRLTEKMAPEKQEILIFLLKQLDNDTLDLA